MWNDLTMQQRADVISMAVKAGMRDMKSIRSFYDETSRSRRFEDGGGIVASIPKLSSTLPDIDITPEYEEIKPKKEIPVEPIKPIERIRTFNKDEDHPILTETQSYVNSPVFVNRLRRMTSSNGAAAVIAGIARENVNNTELKNWPTESNIGASYNSSALYTPSYYHKNENIPVYPRIKWGRSPYNETGLLSQKLSDPVMGTFSYYGNHFTPQGILHERMTLAHELSHSFYKDWKNYNEYETLTPEYRKVLDRGIQKDSYNSSHDNKWTEKIADIWGLQQFAKDNNIWDKSSDTEFTKEMYDKLKSKIYETLPQGNGYSPNVRSFDMWNDEDLRWLINTTAQNSTPILDDSNGNYLLANGGHLFADGGIKKYTGDSEDIGYDVNSMRFYEKATGKELGDSAILDEVIVNGRNRINDYLTEANDNTSVYNVPHREYNLHLKDRAEQGAREAAIWREEHPTMSAWGDAAASIPLAVASVPLIAGGAEALAGTSAGQAASSALLSLSNLAKGSTIAGTPAWAWADAGLTSAFAANGASEIAKGNITPEALLEVAPLGQLARPLYTGVLKSGIRQYNPRHVIKQITAENAASITPEQWTVAQDAAIAKALNITPEETASLTKEQYEAAIARGINTEELSRLRLLHNSVKAPNNKIRVNRGKGEPFVLHHDTDNKPWNVYDDSYFGKTDEGWYGKGLYLSGAPFGKNAYGKNTMKLFANVENPVYAKDNFEVGLTKQFFNRGIPKEDALKILESSLEPNELELFLKHKKSITKALDRVYNADGVIVPLNANGALNRPYSPYHEVVVPDGRKVKSADVVTFNDNGVRIPLGERDDFNINDIRYGLLPFGIGLTGLGLVNEE